MITQLRLCRSCHHKNLNQNNFKPVLRNGEQAISACAFYLILSFTGVRIMPICCPSCGSMRVFARNHARKLGGIAGTVGGTASGVAGAMTGAQSGAALGAIAGPIGMTLGGLAGAILGGLAGGTAGGLAGAKMGEEIDARVLDNYECLNCGQAFSQAEH
ncbi:hypothetical protein [Pseudomonas putida]|uniref:hypothetical protein n=1 Tax=Pseudomonas putida TaxID=303 RepID=UPI0032AFA51D